MEVTKEFLKEKRACTDGLKWWCENCEGLDNISQIKKLAKYRPDWANWLIVRIMTYKQYVSYAVYAAEQVLDIFEKKYPEDKRPRKAIEAAKKCIDNPTEKNRRAAYAAYAAYAAAAASEYTAYAAASAVDAVAAAEIEWQFHQIESRLRDFRPAKSIVTWHFGEGLEKCLHQLACDFAEHVPQKSPKSVEALRVKRLWIEGEATDEEREIASAVAAAYAAYAAAAASEYTAYAAASAVGAVADAEIEWQLHQIESRLIEEE